VLHPVLAAEDDRRQLHPAPALQVLAERLDDGVGAHVDPEAVEVETPDLAGHALEGLGVIQAPAPEREALAHAPQERRRIALLGRRLDRQARRIRGRRAALQPQPRVHGHAADGRGLEPFAGLDGPR
jgi:hypothetical protein